jgi:dTDP-4-amino-4,6-dideoxygalactose transaminase
MTPIYVTKTYLPPIEEYQARLQGIWERVQLTNNGPLVRELEAGLREYLGVKHAFFCSNGTVAIQIALKVLGITGEVITTPFSYCATSHTVVWENCTPVFADIHPTDFCLDPVAAEALVTERTQAILATHVYGNPCQVEALEDLARRHNLRLIYDGAHAFGTRLNDRSLLSYGDISTCSFHATKVFHTVEGGAIVTDNDDYAHLIGLYRSFGHINDSYYSIGINGKNSEFHAAMGLCNLPRVPEILERRRVISERYDAHLLPSGKIRRPHLDRPFTYNHAYYPIVFESEEILLRVRAALEAQQVFTRRYFYPSLNTLDFLQPAAACPVSEDAALRVLCLPLYVDLNEADVDRIAGLVLQHL